jgi:hypothetical protein
MAQIEDEFIKESSKWDDIQRIDFNKQWNKHLKDNNLLINDLNRIQYWWRFIKNKQVEQ